MNQTTRRKTRHLLHFLLTWVVICTQITLPLGALLAAVQPTPQMVQATAQQAGLGDWIADAASKATAWVQPLWGEPASAKAATTYGNPVALLSTTHGATITTGRTGLCTILNCFINNSANVVDSNTANFGNISIPLGLLGGVYFSVDTTATFPAGTRAGFLIDNGGGLIDLSLFSSFSLTTYLSGVQQESVSSAALLDVSLFGGANSNAISFVTTKNFDEVRLTAGSLIGALLDLDVFYAFVQYPTAGTALWGIKNYTNFGYLNTAVSPWTWVTVATLTGGNYNAAAAITRSQGIIFNQTTRVFHLVHPTTGALTALTLTNAGSIPRTLNYNVATYDPATNRYFAALENDQYGHIFTVNTATNQITYVSEINAGTSINSDDWVFVNGKVVGLDHGTLETWDVTNNTYAETSAPGTDIEQEVAGMWVNADGTIGFVSHTTDVGQYNIGTNTKSLVAQTNASFPCCGEPNDLAGSIFGLTGNLPGGLLNQPYAGSVTAGGGAPPYSNYTATGLPAGLNIIAATGAVTGTPTAGGTFPVTFSVTDSENYTATATFNIFIREGAPGGVVTDLAFWYNSESGVTLNSGKVSSWVDQANGIAVTPAVASNGPTYYDAGANLINFNPTLNFTNATRQDGLRATSGLPAIPNGVSTFSVLLPDDASSRWFLQWGVSGAGYYVNYGTGCGANNPGVWTNSHGGCVNTPTTLGPITTPSFLSSRWNSTAGTNQWQLRRNGQLHSGATTSTALNVPADTALEIGDVNQRTAGNEYVGNISEVIGYTARVSDVDRQKIESYLAIKYGITYMNDANTAARDYLDSAGATVWDATANSSYSSNIAGIGRDDASVLQQKQSKSVNSGFQPAIGLGAVAASNAANNNSFSANKSFLLWGDNGQAASYGASYTPGSFSPAAGYFRMNRIWKVQETGTITNVVVQATDTDHLLVSSDPTFATGVTEIDMSSGSATVNFSNGQYFTFGRELVAPGGVSAELGVWLRADQGSSTTTDGQTVGDWADFGPGGNDVTQPTAANQPKFKEVNLNFNPALEFDGSNDVLYKSDGSTIIPNQTDPVSMLTDTTLRAVAAGHN